MESECCGAPIYEETDICSACREHCEPIKEEDEIDLLIEDYKIKLIYLNKKIDEDDVDSISDRVKIKTKASCFRTFITELERLK